MARRNETLETNKRNERRFELLEIRTTPTKGHIRFESILDSETRKKLNNFPAQVSVAYLSPQRWDPTIAILFRAMYEYIYLQQICLPHRI